MTKQNFHIQTFGNPAHPVVVCLHGLLGSARTLYKLSQKISEKNYFVFTYDQRGHGHSPHFPEYNLQVMAEDLWKILAEHELNKIHLIGHSMGGRVSLSAATQHPDHILSLSILDIGLQMNPNALQNIQEIVDPLPSFFESKAEAEAYTNKFSPNLQKFVLSNLRFQEESKKYTWLFDLEGIRSQLVQDLQNDQSPKWEKWATYGKPTLILRGETSDHFSVEELNKMKNIYPAAIVKTIPQAGHWLHVDNFDATVEALVSFLQTQR